MIIQKFGKIETIYDVKHLGKQKSNKKPSNYYVEFMNDLLVEQPPPVYSQFSDYYTVQA